MKIKEVKMICTDYLGLKKEVLLEQEHIKELEKMPDDELLKRFEMACKSYSRNYWVTGYINNKKVCQYQWAEL